MTPAAHLAITQFWQLTALIVAVALSVRLTARRRPHLAHVLWLVVLAKCLTPPLLASPGGIFCRWQPRFDWLNSPPGLFFSELPEAQREPGDLSAAHRTRQSARWLERARGETSRASSGTDGNNADQYASFDASVAIDREFDPDRTLIAAESPVEGRVRSGRMSEQSAFTFKWIGKPSCFQVGAAVWLVGCLLIVILAGVRLTLCLRSIARNSLESPLELQSLLGSLQRRLGVRRRVRLAIVGNRVGPAVVGLLRPTIVLPAEIVRAQSIHTLEAILAHELVHVRRGDLWSSLIQVLAQGVWWFHPLVWLVNRSGSRVAEACCDEEVIAELGYDPGAYAQCLLEVLEMKTGLTPIPAFPGMRPVDVTRQRLERIMQLGQGCRKRTPWWCWAVLIVVAAATLPGAALVSHAQEELAPSGDKTRKHRAPTESRPRESDDLDAVATLELVFADDLSRRKLPAVIIGAEELSLIVTTGPAIAVPDRTAPAIDAQFLHIDGIPPIRTLFGHDSTGELIVFRAPGKWTTYRPNELVRLAVGDSLTAVCEPGPSGWRATPAAARVIAFDRETEFQFSNQDMPHKFTNLIELDRALPEGTPLFKDGRLAGIILLGSRFLGADTKRSYVVPVNRIAELCDAVLKKPVKVLRALAGDDNADRVAVNLSVSRERTKAVQSDSNAVNGKTERPSDPGDERADDARIRPLKSPLAATDSSPIDGIGTQGEVSTTAIQQNESPKERGAAARAVSAPLPESDRRNGPPPGTNQDDRRAETALPRSYRIERRVTPAELAASRNRIAEPSRRYLSSVAAITRINSGNRESGQNRRSGVVFDKRGYVVTVWSEMDQSRDRFLVTLADKTEYLARPVASDPALGLAILRLRMRPDQAIAAVPLADARAPRHGEPIVAVPSPTKGKAETGVVTGVGQRLGDLFPRNLIQSDLRLELGEAGSLIVTGRGEPLGIGVAMRVKNLPASYAVPMADVLPLLKKALSDADANTQPILRVYPVADLVIPVAHRYVAVPLPDDSERAEKKPALSFTSNVDFGWILELIRSTVAPEIWESAGGSGSIRPFDKTLSPVVRQSPIVHEEIADLLGQLRRMRDLRAQLDLEFIRLREGEFARGLVPTEQPASPGERTARLTAEELHVFREKLSGNEQVLSRDALKMKLENGQGVELALRRVVRGGTGEPPVVQLVPVISADRRRIRLRFATGAASALDALARSRTIDANDGQTLLVDLSDEFPAGPIGGIPVQSGPGFFKAVPVERVLLLMTVKVDVADEAEEALNTAVPATSPPSQSQP
jgi:beta-lactamase regulating signal transducer with metallopeptidase domain/S1-C subfamily serine protease